MSIKQSLNVALVGYGYWGPNLMRNFINSPFFKVKYLVEPNVERSSGFTDSNPSIQVLTNLDVVLKDSSLHCVAISSPPNTHFEIAKRCLESGKHILVEKPFTTSYDDAKTLVHFAEANKLRIFVDYTFLYNGTVETIKKSLADKDRFGELLYLDSVRINLGIFQSHVNVVWDLACHDISIFNYWLEDRPMSVQAIGVDGLNNGIENIAYIHLKYSNKFAQINCSWSSPVKIRQMLIGGTKQAILYNDIEPTDKIKVYDKGVVFNEESERKELLQDYRTGEIYIPKYDTREALSKVVEAFYRNVQLGEDSMSSGKKALEVSFILEMIQKSILLNGKEIAIDWEQLGV